MRLSLLLAALLFLLTVWVTSTADAARARFSYRSRFRVRLGRSVRYSSSRHTYVGPLYSRRLSPSLMGPVYYAYASRYPLYFNYHRTPLSAGASSAGEACTNYLALSNGSFIGAFRCPFLPDEPSGWTKCCGYDNEEFCCDPDYDDSWKLAVGLSAIAIVAIVGACLLAAGLLIFLVICCCVKKRSGGSSAGSSATLSASVGTESRQEDGVSNPVKPPYPTMEYGTVQPPTAGATAPYPPVPPYPPPYSAQN